VLTDLGVTPTLFRPPFGFTDDNVLAAAAEVGLRTVRWSVDSHDWEEPPAADIVSRVAAGLHPGAIILLHDGGGDRSATVAAVPLVVAAVEAAGMWCDDLSSLAYR